MRVLAALLVLCAAPARADDGADARSHYEAGEKLYDEGTYDEAIVEFQAAYAKKPHPNALYNIGQAYERLLDYDASVRAFERYLGEAEPGDPRRKIVENRLRVLRGLPARVSVSTIPDHVRATLHDGSSTVTAETPHVFAVPSGTYELELELPGWEPEHTTLHAAIGQPYFYQYRLERSRAEATIETSPPGARVFIDERLVGETPFQGLVDVGKHGLLLEHPDYPWHREAFTIAQGQRWHRAVLLEKPPRSGRTELVLASMAYGGVVGPLLVGALSGSTQFTQSAQGLATLLLSSVAGIGAGFFASFLTTRDGVPVGTSSLIIGGGGFGSGIGAGIALGANASERAVYGSTIVGGAVGIASTALYARLRGISAGDAAMINSGGLWGTAAGALLSGALPWASGRPSLGQVGWFVVGGSVVGLGAGMLSARFLDRTRTEVAIVDLGGVVGTGLGFALGYAVGANANNDDSIAQGTRFALGGMVVGLVSGVFVGRRFARRPVSLKAGHAKLEIPQLRFEQLRLPEGTGARVSLDLFRGRW